MEFTVSNISLTETLAKAFMLSAYEACGGETGMGFLQAVNNMSIDNILQYCILEPDYTDTSFSVIRADYLAGRMMKTSIAFNSTEGVVKISDQQPTSDYQGWASGIPSDPGVLRGFQQRQGGYQKIDGSAILHPITKFNTYLELLQYSAARVGVELSPISVATA